MWRYVGSALCALFAIGSCQPECDDPYYVYRCSVYYSPYYGYYEACYPVRYKCPDKDRCKGSKCNDDNPPPACKADDDCEPGKVCNDEGNCAVPSTPDGGAGGAGPDAAATGGASSSDGGSTGSGATSSSGGAPDETGGTTGETGGASSGDGADVSGTGGVGSSTGGASASTGGAGTGGSSAGGRIRRFNFPCVRDTQCGAGDCADGLCYTACESDAECGTADRCSVESGRRMCNPDPNPPVRCDESADCLSTQACLNGACHDKCEVDTDCVDPQDRCEHGFCSPDRRPIAECVLNLECPSGLSCLDARCVDLSSL